MKFQLISKAICLGQVQSLKKNLHKYHKTQNQAKKLNLQ